MSEESVIIASVFIIILLCVVAFLGYRGIKLDSRSAPLNAPKKEPVFSNSSPQPPVAAVSVAAVVDAAVGDAADDAVAEEKTPQQELPLMFEVPTLPSPDKSLLTADICYIVHFYGEKPLQAAAFAPLSEALAKRQISVYRLLGYSEKDGEWKKSLTEAFSHWLAAVPLANRSGQLGEDKINFINEESRRFAQRLQLHPVFPPLDATLRRAQMLDSFCHTVDMILEFRMRCSAVSPEQVSGIMATQKLVSKNGRHVYRVESESLFFVRSTFYGNSASLFFTLDTPKVSSPERAFESMIACMRRVATVLNGVITDPNGEDIGEERLDEIKRQLLVLRKQMTEYGVPPGGAMAHLLFS